MAISQPVEALLMLFFPQYYDPESPQYVDPAIIDAMAYIATDARPWCLSESEQNMAQAFFTAYLISLRQETSSGKTSVPVSGPITSEKEGDIQINYGTSSTGVMTGSSNRPASDPWDGWNRLWQRCAKGAILTRFGDPCRVQSSQSLTKTLASNALSWT